MAFVVHVGCKVAVVKLGFEGYKGEIYPYGFSVFSCGGCILARDFTELAAFIPVK